MFQRLCRFLFQDTAAGLHHCAMGDTFITDAPNSLLLSISYTNSIIGLALLALHFPLLLLSVSLVPMKQFNPLETWWNIILNSTSSQGKLQSLVREEDRCMYMLLSVITREVVEAGARDYL